jgi:hypothetical protein
MVYGEIVVKQANSAELRWGMFCHKKCIKLLKMRTHWPSPFFGDIFVTKKIGDVLSRGRIVQRTFCPEPEFVDHFGGRKSEDFAENPIPQISWTL